MKERANSGRAKEVKKLSIEVALGVFIVLSGAAGLNKSRTDLDNILKNFDEIKADELQLSVEEIAAKKGEITIFDNKVHVAVSQGIPIPTPTSSEKNSIKLVAQHEQDQERASAMIKKERLAIKQFLTITLMGISTFVAGAGFSVVKNRISSFKNRT